MKELLVVRHGKSSWAESGLEDHERPLAERGQAAAPEMGARLRRRGVTPDRLVSSDAVRARETAALLAEGLGLSTDAILLEPRLYTADPGEVLKVVQRLDTGHDRIAIVGHNPALHEFVQMLSDLRVDKFPTAAVAHLRFDVDGWSAIGPDSHADVVDYDYPKSGREDT